MNNIQFYLYSVKFNKVDHKIEVYDLIKLYCCMYIMRVRYFINQYIKEVLRIVFVIFIRKQNI